MKCVVKVANNAKLSEKIKRQAMNIMHDIIKSGASAGKDSIGVAGLVIYVSSFNTSETITQMDIADAAGVTEVTIRNRYKDIKKHLSLFKPKSIPFLSLKEVFSCIKYD
jgi:transcription initiation factor TFIIB